jgi:hypothetical protein
MHWNHRVISYLHATEGRGVAGGDTAMKRLTKLCPRQSRHELQPSLSMSFVRVVPGATWRRIMAVLRAADGEFAEIETLRAVRALRKHLEKQP